MCLESLTKGQVSLDTHITYSTCQIPVYGFIIKRNIFHGTEIGGVRFLSVPWASLEGTFASGYRDAFRSGPPLHSLLSDRDLLLFLERGEFVAESTVVDDPNLSLLSFMFPLELNELWRVQIICIMKGSKVEIRIYETSWKYLPLKLQTSYINTLKTEFRYIVSQVISSAISMDNSLFSETLLSTEKFTCSITLTSVLRLVLQRLFVACSKKSLNRKRKLTHFMRKDIKGSKKRLYVRNCSLIAHWL